jgi:hypothetical protein
VNAVERTKPKTGLYSTVRIGEKPGPRACVAAKLGALVEVEGNPDPRYTVLIIHDLRWPAIRNRMKLGVNQKVAMKISEHKRMFLTARKMRRKSDFEW